MKIFDVLKGKKKVDSCFCPTCNKEIPEEHREMSTKYADGKCSLKCMSNKEILETSKTLIK